MAMKDWSTTASENDTAGSITWAEGQNPNTVNDSARQMMADARTDRDNIEWRDWGHTVNRTSDTTFTISSLSDLSSVYTVGRRIKCTDTSILYGTIVASSFAASTQTVTVYLDSGILSATLSAVALGFDPTNSPYIARGAFTCTLTGFTTTINGSVEYSIFGNNVGIYIPQNITGASNTTTMTMTGLPSLIIPSVNRVVSFRLQSGSSYTYGYAEIDATGVITFSFGANIGFAFTASATKGVLSGPSGLYPL